MNGNHSNYGYPNNYGNPSNYGNPPQYAQNMAFTNTLTDSVAAMTSTVQRLESKIESLHDKALLFSTTASPSLDTQRLMYNIHTLVNDNDSLRNEMKEKNRQIEKQCEKVAELLNKNQALLQMNNIALEESHLLMLANSNESSERIASLELENTGLYRELNTLRSDSNNRTFEEESKRCQIASLQSQIEALYLDNTKLQTAVFEAKNELAACKISSDNGHHQEDILKNELKKMKSRMDSCLLEKLELSQQLDDQSYKAKEAQAQLKSQISRHENELTMLKLHSEDAIIATRYEDTISSLETELSLAKDGPNVRGDSELYKTNSESGILIKHLQEQLDNLSNNTEGDEPTLIPSVNPSPLEQANDLEQRIAILTTELCDVKSSVRDTVKKIINRIFLEFRAQVNVEESYSGRDVLVIAMRIIKEVTLSMVNESSDDESSQSSNSQGASNNAQHSHTANVLPAMIQSVENTADIRQAQVTHPNGHLN